MTPSEIFEILNDFLSFGEPEQILDLCTDLEIVHLPFLGIEEMIAGGQAPEVMRRAVRERVSRNLKWSDRIELKVQHTSIGHDTAIFVVKITSGTFDSTSIITVMASSYGARGLVQGTLGTEGRQRVSSKAKPSKASSSKKAEPKLVEISRTRKKT